MFSTICICFSTSISRSAACTCRFTPSRSAASWAPRRMSTKNGWFNVFSTSATVFLSPARGVSRLHDGATRASATTNSSVRLRMSVSVAFEDRVDENGADNDAADHDLLKERRYTKQIEAVAQDP